MFDPGFVKIQLVVIGTLFTPVTITDDTDTEKYLTAHSNPVKASPEIQMARNLIHPMASIMRVNISNEYRHSYRSAGSIDLTRQGPKLHVTMIQFCIDWANCMRSNYMASNSFTQRAIDFTCEQAEYYGYLGDSELRQTC